MEEIEDNPSVREPVQVPKEKLGRLAEITSSPGAMYLRGSCLNWEEPAIAIVGSRNATPYGLQIALQLSKRLAEAGFLIVSGLARGIDRAAHLGALLARGKTVAVLAHGLDRVYPAENRAMAETIVKQGGALISEYAWGVPPLRHHFPERNRLVSGLSLGVVVVQAAKRSGSLITARYALEQNRDVFVVPAEIGDPAFEGNLDLIQQGAKLVHCARDVMDEYPYLEISIKEPPEDTCFVGNFLKRKRGGVLLRTIYDRFPSRLGDASDRLQRLIERSKVVEIRPQTYVWVG